MASTRTARFIISAVDQTRETIRRITGNVNGLGSSFQRMGRLVGPAIAGLATGAAVKGFASMIQRANDLTDSLRDTSIRLGIGVSDLQAYQLAAGNAGIDAGQLTGIIGKLNKAAGEIKLGSASDKTVEAFNAIGISVAEVERSKPAELFEKVIEGLGGIQDPATRAALAMQVFGKSGQTALTLVAEGTGGLRESRKLLDEMGLSLTNLDADNVDAANDALGTLAKVAQAAKQKIGAELAPIIAKVGNDLLEAGRKGGGFGEMIESGVGQAVEIFSRLTEVVFAVGNTFSAAFNVVQGIISNLVAAVLGFASDFVTAIGTTAPNAFNGLLEAGEEATKKLMQGFSDMSTSIANGVIGAMNMAIKAVEKLVNESATALNQLIQGINALAGTNFGPIGSVSLGELGKYQYAQFDRPSFGRVGTFGQGAAQSLGDTSSAFGRSANEQFLDAGTDVRQAFDGFGDALSAEGGDINKALIEATEYANKLTNTIDPASANGSGNGSGGGGGGGATGAVKKLAEGADKAGDSIKQTFKILDEYGKAVTSSLEKGIDDFVKNGKLSVSEFGASLLRDLAAITAKAAILGGIFGSAKYGGNGQGLVGSLISGFLSGSIPSANGGGFTGMGSRSGGIDGKGGFPAILHPNETVIDHTRGQTMGGGTINQTVVIRETMAAGQARGIVNAAVEASKAAFAQINARGGNRRKAYGLG